MLIPWLSATYKFSLLDNNLSSDTGLVFTLVQTGTVLHKKTFLNQFKKKLVLKNLSFEKKKTIRQQLSETRNHFEIFKS